MADETEAQPNGNEDQAVEGTVESKEISLTPALSDLFRPTTKLLGIELRDYVGEKIHDWKNRKRGENLQEHLERIAPEIEANRERRSDAGDELTLEDAEVFEAWSHRVQDIDPNETDMCASLDQLLKAALDRRAGELEIKTIIENLDFDMIEILRRRVRNNIFVGKVIIYNRNFDSHAIDKLEKIYLVRKLDMIEEFAEWISYAVIFIFTLLVLGIISRVELLEISNFFWTYELNPLLIVSSLILVLGSFAMLSRMKYATRSVEVMRNGHVLIRLLRERNLI